MTDFPQPTGARLQIDQTHLGRRATGIERITRELFSPAALSPLPTDCVVASARRSGVVMAQNVMMPLRALRRPNDVFIFPGFPPSPYFSIARRDRTVLYVHDVFLLTRRKDLNSAAKLYLAPLFSLAVRSLRYFFVNSDYTASNLRQFCQPEAKVISYRPSVRNVFGAKVGNRAHRSATPSSLQVVAIGTIEPRKNLRAAAEICSAIAGRLGVPVHLHLIGRIGWGADADWLSRQPNVTLHGPLGDHEACSIVEASDFLISTSRDEGLGLPLLEVQHAGLPVIAPDQTVFREVLGDSGLLINPDNPADAADAVAAVCGERDWRANCAHLAIANVARWNDLARRDQTHVSAFLGDLLTRPRLRQASTVGELARGKQLPMSGKMS
jgi:glycosyltransferase involved in cell wall biosynthesis